MDIFLLRGKGVCGECSETGCSEAGCCGGAGDC